MEESASSAEECVAVHSGRTQIGVWTLVEGWERDTFIKGKKEDNT